MSEPVNHLIKVTQQVIDKSKKGNARKCMVAHGIALSIPGSSSIDVTADTCRFNLSDEKGNNIRYIYDISGNASKQIQKFDDNKKVIPFSFKLDARQAFCKPVIIVRKRKKKIKIVKKNNVTPCKRVVTGRRSTTRRRHGFKVVK